MVESWVTSQKRTMARWVSSKVGREIGDISVDLCNGIVLSDLVNKIASDTGASTYQHVPIYKKPMFALQKMENVDDVLKFCRLIMQVNTCNISAEDIVSGNSKLILGLIWSLFVFSSARLVTSSSDSRSIPEIKSILLKWLNVIGKAKALPEISNFNKDWSVQQEKRPDLVFAAVLDFYSPNLVDFESIWNGRRLAGLEKIISLADQQLGIPDLALADDFNMLVPDEKCILFYVLEWYMYFEIHNKELFRYSPLGTPESAASATTYVETFFPIVIRAVKLKNKYDTRSLRLLNQLNSHIRKMDEGIEALDTHNASREFETQVNIFCADIDESGDFEKQLGAKIESTQMELSVEPLKRILAAQIKFKLETKSAIIYSDIPELQNLTKSLNLELKTGGFRCSYEPLKVLSLESLSSKLRQLSSSEENLHVRISSALSSLASSKFGEIEALISFVARRLPNTDKGASEVVQKYTRGLEALLSLKKIICEYQDIMRQEHTISDLKVLIKSIQFYDLPPTPVTPEESQFFQFQKEVAPQVNKSNLTFSDLKKFLRKVMPPAQYQGPEFQEFIRLIPTRTLLTRSESTDFGTASHSDDSDDPDSIFDRVSHTLEGKLSGAHGKIYDLSLFVDRMESDFNV